jgi:hypothetical protein
MRVAAFLWVLLVPALSQAAEPPRIVGVSKLSSLPVRQSQGAGGPINRLAFDLTGFEASDAVNGVSCRYATGMRYRCRVTAGAPGSALRRFVVEIPDLDLGREVSVQFVNQNGATEHRLQIANPPQTVHEIEAFDLPEGGATTTGPDGGRARVETLRTWQIPSTPAMLLELRPQTSQCDALHAQWLGASATDPVFSSEFGALNGAVAELKPVQKNSPVRDDNLPLWLITYMASAKRVQFIAHYEVVYKLGVCADRVIR